MASFTLTTQISYKLIINAKSYSDRLYNSQYLYWLFYNQIAERKYIQSSLSFDSSASFDNLSFSTKTELMQDVCKLSSKSSVKRYNVRVNLDDPSSMAEMTEVQVKASNNFTENLNKSIEQWLNLQVMNKSDRLKIVQYNILSIDSLIYSHKKSLDKNSDILEIDNYTFDCQNKLNKYKNIYYIAKISKEDKYGLFIYSEGRSERLMNGVQDLSVKIIKQRNKYYYLFRFNLLDNYCLDCKVEELKFVIPA